MSSSSAARRRAARSRSRSRARRSRSRPTKPQMSSSADSALKALRFELLDGRIRGAVETVAASDPNPTDPFRGLYISDDLALTLARTASADGLDARLQQAAELLGLDLLDAAVLALCTAPELSPRYGRLYAYLHDDVTRKLASPRLVARLLEGDGVAAGDVLACFAADAPLRRRGALRLLEGGGPIPLAERPVKVADRLAGFLLGSGLDEAARDGRVRRVPRPECDPGRADVVAKLHDVLAIDSRLPVVIAGPDAATLLAAALDRPVVLADVLDVLDADVMRDAALAEALEGGRLAFDGIAELEPNDRRRALRALAALEQRPLLCVASREAAVALGDETALIVEAPLPSFAERKQAWAELANLEDVGDVAAKFRLSVGQIVEAAEVARLAAATRGDERPTTEDLDLGAREASSTRLGELATRLDPAFAWDDLVLPERQRDVLGSISAYLRHRDLVLSEWGYERA